jgi:hypothetical protein
MASVFPSSKIYTLRVTGSAERWHQHLINFLKPLPNQPITLKPKPISLLIPIILICALASSIRSIRKQ